MNTARPFAILTAVLALVIGTPLLVVAAHDVEPQLVASPDVTPQIPTEDVGRELDPEATLIPFEIFRGESGLSF